jgi:perosamine synthetase
MGETLALHGGVPVRATTLPYARHSVDDRDADAVLAALRSDWLTTGPLVGAFERAVASTVGARHGVALNSGTAALHASVAAAGIRPGDEVITSPLTFVASANAVLYCGGTPVFADVDPETLMLEPDAARRAVTPRTRALLPVDFAGQPCDHDALAVVARAHGLTVIEDAAHAFGAEYHGRPVGTLVDLTVFSFHPAKVITTGEGGLVTTDRDDLAARLRAFRNHGFETDFRERLARRAAYSPMTELGFNYRLTDVQCALGLSQMSKLDQFLKRRNEIAERYAGALAGVPALRRPAVRADVRHAWHIYPVLLELERLTADRDTIVAALRAENIGVAIHYVPAYWHPYYERLGYARGLCPRAEAAFERLVSLPLFPSMSNSDVDDVVAAVAKVVGYYRR